MEGVRRGKERVSEEEEEEEWKMMRGREKKKKIGNFGLVVGSLREPLRGGESAGYL